MKWVLAILSFAYLGAAILGIGTAGVAVGWLGFAIFFSAAAIVEAVNGVRDAVRRAGIVEELNRLREDVRASATTR